MFKVGDKVRRVCNLDSSFWKRHCTRVGKNVGDVFTARSPLNRYSLHLEGLDCVDFNPDNFEKVEEIVESKYKVGDKVIIERTSASKFAGQVATVTHVRRFKNTWSYKLEGSCYISAQHLRKFKAEILESKLNIIQSKPVSDKNHAVIDVSSNSRIYHSLSFEEAKEKAEELLKGYPNRSYYIIQEKMKAKVSLSLVTVTEML